MQQRSQRALSHLNTTELTTKPQGSVMYSERTVRMRLFIYYTAVICSQVHIV